MRKDLFSLEQGLVMTRIESRGIFLRMDSTSELVHKSVLHYLRIFDTTDFDPKC